MFRKVTTAASRPRMKRGHSDEQLCELAGRMRDSPQRRRGRERVPAMKAGYVYLGQFIDHDLTRDHKTLDETTPAAEEAVNFRTPNSISIIFTAKIRRRRRIC